MTEIELVTHVGNFLKISSYNIGYEIPSMGRSVDIVAEKNNVFTFIEAKLFNWKKALSQCQPHKLVADYIYIAISTKKISQSFLKDAKSSGFGIIHFNKQTCECSIVLEAESNLQFWLPQKLIMIQKFKNHLSYGFATLDDFRNIC